MAESDDDEMLTLRLSRWELTQLEDALFHEGDIMGDERCRALLDKLRSPDSPRQSHKDRLLDLLRDMGVGHKIEDHSAEADRSAVVIHNDHQSAKVGGYHDFLTQFWFNPDGTLKEVCILE